MRDDGDHPRAGATHLWCFREEALSELSSPYLHFQSGAPGHGGPRCLIPTKHLSATPPPSHTRTSREGHFTILRQLKPNPDGGNTLKKLPRRADPGEEQRSEPEERPPTRGEGSTDSQTKRSLHAEREPTFISQTLRGVQLWRWGHPKWGAAGTRLCAVPSPGPSTGGADLLLQCEALCGPTSTRHPASRETPVASYDPLLPHSKKGSFKNSENVTVFCFISFSKNRTVRMCLVGCFVWDPVINLRSFQNVSSPKTVGKWIRNIWDYDKGDVHANDKLIKKNPICGIIK